MSRDLINYGKLVDEAMHIIVFKVLKEVQVHGLPGNHHFFISFATQHPEVVISKSLSARYPKEMTIVIQYQYQDLEVTSKGFSVSLSFGGVKEKIHVPFAAITTFADPSVQFGLQFRETDFEDLSDEIEIEIDEQVKASSQQKKAAAAVPAKAAAKKGSKKKAVIAEDDASNVISLDKYRK